MASTFFILKLAPPELRSQPPAVRIMFQAWVVELTLERKDKELAAGINASGGKLPPVRPKTRKYRRSAMTPTGRGDPTAPYLQPGRGLSRTRSLLAGKAHPDYAEFWWRYDAHTGDQWGRILAIHARRGKAYDVVGLSPKGQAWVQAEALKLWAAWKSGRSIKGPGSGPTVPAVPPGTAVARVGKGYSKATTFGIGSGEDEARRALAEGRAAGGMRSDEWEKHFRASAPPVGGLRPGTSFAVRKGASNVLLRHVWSGPPIPPGGPPKPPPPAPKPSPAARPKPVSILKPRRKAADSIRLRGDLTDETRARVTRVLELIDRVHSCEGLPTIPLGSDEALMDARDAAGLFYSGTVANQKIEVTGQGTDAIHATPHEFGHFVDWNLFSGPEDVDAGGGWRHPAVIGDKALAEWWSTVGDSESIIRIRLALQKVDPGDPSRDAKEKFYKYLLRAREVWARCYAQWIALRCGDDDYLEEFKKAGGFTVHGVEFNVWEDEDFESVARAMDKVFESRGLLNPKIRGRSK